MSAKVVVTFGTITLIFLNVKWDQYEVECESLNEIYLTDKYNILWKENDPIIELVLDSSKRIPVYFEPMTTSFFSKLPNVD